MSRRMEPEHLLGDPIEARALGTVLGRGRPEDSPLLIGAIKSNLGHLEAAAGIAGFIKAVLAVQRGHIPPNLGFQTPNPHIPFDQTASESRCRANRTGRRRGVRGGRGCRRSASVATNAHVVVEQGAGCWVRRRRRGAEPAVTHVGGVGQDAGAGGVAGRRCWPTGWRVPGPRWRWPMWRTR